MSGIPFGVGILKYVATDDYIGTYMCGTNWGYHESMAMCKYLGYVAGYVIRNNNLDFSYLYLEGKYDNVVCPANASFPSDCTFTVLSSGTICTEPVVLHCFPRC